MFIHWLFIVSIDLPSSDLKVYLPINNKVLIVSLSHVLPSEYTFTDLRYLRYLYVSCFIYYIVFSNKTNYYLILHSSNAIALKGHIILTLVLNSKQLRLNNK